MRCTCSPRRTRTPTSRKTIHGIEPELAVKVNDLMLPIVKGVGSEQAYAKLTESLQTFGGSGFLQDYPIEQYIRDAKIDSLYEGTTAIQAQDFFFRKIVRDKGVALGHVAGQIEQFVKSETGNGRLKAERALLATALEDVQGMAATLTGYLMAAQEDPASIYKVGLGSVRFLMSVGDLVIGWLLQQPGGGGDREARRRRQPDRRRPRVLRGQARGGVVLREELPADAHQHPVHHRQPRQRGHGTGRGGLLKPLRTTRRPRNFSSRGRLALRPAWRAAPRT